MEMVLGCPCVATCPTSFPWTQEAKEARSQVRHRRECAMAGALADWRRIGRLALGEGVVVDWRRIGTSGEHSGSTCTEGCVRLHTVIEHSSDLPDDKNNPDSANNVFLYY